jgi:hypothetical protein
VVVNLPMISSMMSSIVTQAHQFAVLVDHQRNVLCVLLEVLQLGAARGVRGRHEVGLASEILDRLRG